MHTRWRKFQPFFPSTSSPSGVTCLVMVCTMLVMSCKAEHPLDAPVEGLVQGKISLGVIHHLGDGVTRPDESAGEAPLLLRGERYEVELEQFALVVADVEVHACTTLTEQAAWTKPWRAIPSWLSSTANAHVPESATRLGTPTVEDLLSPPARARILGEVAPPAGSYCKLRVVLAGADEDVVNLSSVDTQRLQGKSAVLRGKLRVLGEGEGAWQSFDVSSTRASIWEIAPGPEPIVLTKKSPGAFVLFDKQISGDLADVLGARFEKSPDGEQLADAAVAYLEERCTRYAPANKP